MRTDQDCAVVVSDQHENWTRTALDRGTYRPKVPLCYVTIGELDGNPVDGLNTQPPQDGSGNNGEVSTSVYHALEGL
jgi:hypothetical protein